MSTTTAIVKPPKPCTDAGPHPKHYWGVGDVRFADIDMKHCPGVYRVEPRPAATP